MKTCLRVASFLIVFLSSACTSNDYGSRHYPIELTTVPAGCQGWIVPNTKWVVEKDKIAREGSAALKGYDSFRTPWNDQMLPYVFVFVALNAQQELRWKEFTPSRDARVVIDFGPEVAAAPPVTE